MKNSLVVLAVLAVLALVGYTSYNGLVTSRNAVEEQWADVQAVYEKRSALIPNLVETVKGAKNHEKETLESVMEARAKATSITVDPSNITPEKMAEISQAQNGLSGALGRLMATVENYPDLKVNQNFLALQTELTGIENEILKERKDFNEMGRIYKDKIEQFPGNIFANIFNFKAFPLFQASQGSEVAPQVNFNK
ncbi:MAG: LemA family protein [Flavobacteriaceae bacterium]|nr:MAG: LemA family protein [Flavobacteriaceae bacterium]